MMKPGIGLFAGHERKGRREDLGDPLVTLSTHVDFVALSNRIDAAAPRSPRAKGGRPPYPTLFGCFGVNALVRHPAIPLSISDG